MYKYIYIYTQETRETSVWKFGMTAKIHQKMSENHRDLLINTKRKAVQDGKFLY